MVTAVYPGTFDPIHNGHIDIALRSARIFDQVIVGIYDRPNKNLMFSVNERLDLAKEVLQDIPNIKVVRYDELTVEFCRRMGAQVIVRGLRVISDFELEYQMALTNRRLSPEIDMVCLMTSLDYAFISSTIVKDVASAGGGVSEFVPEVVARALAAHCRR
ncbi:MAG: pantetheine-phosphate adenylyltransferase [Chloroflexi bacterium]|nr:pantetheine-phosphate adenylyltransferase [Chloroflexota bacterium]